MGSIQAMANLRHHLKRLNPRGIVLAVILGALLFFSPQTSWSHTSKDPDGISNFASVTDTLYRGAQPSTLGFVTLQHMGVGIIVNFRDEHGEMASEKREVESLGMKYVGIPWSGADEPSDAQIVQFLDLVRANPQTKIFVHCKRGADRTGTMIAAYRIVVQHESVSQAVAEMNQYHYSHFWLPQLQSYVISLPVRLQSDAAFSAYAPVPAMNPAAAATAATIVPRP